jgi:hypothetical protein
MMPVMDVSASEHDCRADYGVRQPDGRELTLHLSLARVVGQGRGRIGLRDADVDDSADPGLARRLEQGAGVVHGLREGGSSPFEPDPVGVVEGGHAVHFAVEAVWIVEGVGGRLDRAGVPRRPVRVRGERFHAPPERQQPARDGASGIAECSGDQVKASIVRHRRP